MHSKLRGHAIEMSNDEWVYCDTKESTVLNHKLRPCGHCNKIATPEGHDACLGKLPLVSNACCGHGVISESYIQFFNFLCIRGFVAMKILSIFKCLSVVD